MSQTEVGGLLTMGNQAIGSPVTSRRLRLALVALALVTFSLGIPAGAVDSLAFGYRAAAGVALAAFLLGHALVVRSIYSRGWKSILATGLRRPAIWFAVAFHVLWVLAAVTFFSQVARSLHSALLVTVGYGLFDYWPMVFLIASLTWIDRLPVYSIYFVAGALGVASGIAYGLILEGLGWLSSRRIWAWVTIGFLLFLVSSFFLTAAAILLSISMGWGYHV